jgi:Ca2+/H+ antiporter, TMEM165/GDT1 family
VNLARALTTFAVVLPAELPDKSLFASLVLGTRYRPLPVFVGVAAAFAVHVTVAVAVGGAFSLLPERLVLLVVAALFAGGAGLLLLGHGEERDEEAPAATGPSQAAWCGGSRPACSAGSPARCWRCWPC